MSTLLGSLTILLAIATTAIANEPGFESEDGLLTAVRESIQRKSKDDFLACSCEARLPDKLKARLKTTTPAFMKYKLESIKTLRGAEDPLKGFDGFEYNIKYQGVIQVRFEGIETPIPMPYGIYKERYYLASKVKNGTFQD